MNSPNPTESIIKSNTLADSSNWITPYSVSNISKELLIVVESKPDNSVRILMVSNFDIELTFKILDIFVFLQ